LTNGGKRQLVRLLGGGYVVESWFIQLPVEQDEINSSTPGCSDSDLNIVGANLSLPASIETDEDVNATVTLTAQTSIESKCLSTGSWGIERVITRLVVDSLEPPFLVTSVFTEKTLDSPLNGILPDQVVTIKVEISFS
jgi:hypothetical protein